MQIIDQPFASLFLAVRFRLWHQKDVEFQLELSLRIVLQRNEVDNQGILDSEDGIIF